MSVFGWCAGPEGTTGDHDACRLEIGTDSGVSRCDCPCHATRAVLAQLDGTEATAVAYMVGVTSAELDDLGGVE